MTAPLDAVPVELVTPYELLDDLATLAKASPERVNPLHNDGGCAYLSGEVRCLIGQWLADRGHTYRTSWEHLSARDVLEDLGYPVDTCDVASLAQGAADGHGRPRPWGGLVDMLLRMRDNL